MKNRVVIVATDSRKLLAVEVGGGGNGFEVLRLAECLLPGGQITAEWLREVWQKHSFQCKRTICLLPSDLVEFRILRLPHLDPEQMESALRLEYETKNELYVVVSKQTEGQEIEVKTAVTSDGKLQDYLNVFEAAGLQVLWSGLRFRGLHAFLNFHVAYLENAPIQVYFDSNEDHLEMGLIDDSQLLYRRNLGLSFRDLQQQTSQTLEDLLEEVRLFFAVALRQTDRIPDKAWLFGDLQPGLLPAQALAEEFRVELDCPRQSRLTGVLTGPATPRFAALLGLALDALNWDSHPELRFQTKAQKQRSAGRDRWWIMARAGAIILMILGGLSLGLRAQALKEAKDLAWIEHNSRRLARLTRLTAETRHNLQTIYSLEGWLQNRGVKLEFLKVLQASLPEGTTIADIYIEDGQLKNLSGVTSSVSELLHNFQRHPVLKGLKLKGAIVSDKDGREQFQMEGAISVKEAH
jgi:Tfp pilus assembly protein PilN